jgi:hypothetical protein
MTEPSPQCLHCHAFLAANADRGVHKPAHDFDRPPTHALPEVPDTVTAQRMTVTFATPRSSFDVWAALAPLELMLSDYRRLAPRFTVEQLTGQDSVAAGNEYRVTVTDASRICRIETACSRLAGDDKGGALEGRRCMDIRIVRAGPWGGETGELVVEALCNHAMAGSASLWILIHGDDPEGQIQVRLDLFEIVRWAWEPDRLAAAEPNEHGLLDWPYLFERLAAAIDATPVTEQRDSGFTHTASVPSLSRDDRVREALSFHPALAPLVTLQG